MWWRGGDDEVDVALDRLDETGPHRDLLGYGMAYHRGAQVPLLISPEKRDPRPGYWGSGPGVGRWIVRALVAGRDVPVPPWVEVEPGWPPEDFGGEAAPPLLETARQLVRARAIARRAGVHDLRLRGIAIPLDQADRQTRAVASIADLPPSTLVSYWPHPRFTRHRLSDMRGHPYVSPGLRVTTGDGRHLLATAGHINIEVGQPVFTSPGRWRPPRLRQVGVVAWRSDPRRSPPVSINGQSYSIDLALIDVTDDLPSGRAIGAAVDSAVDDGTLCEWDGATSGFTRGDVVGSLRTMEVEGVSLTHCWYVASDCRGGDSGTAVVDLRQGAVLGQVVGARGTRRKGGARPGTLVQHIGVLEAVLQRDYAAPTSLEFVNWL